MKDTNYLSIWIKRFLLEYLISTRNLSKKTQQSYRDTFKLLLPCMLSRSKKAIDKLLIDDIRGLSIQLCKFIHKPLNIVMNSIFKFYQKMSHSFTPILNWHSPFCSDIINCQV